MTFYAKQYFYHLLGLPLLIKNGYFDKIIPFIFTHLWQWNWSLLIQCFINNPFLTIFFIPGLIEIILQVKFPGSKHASYLIPLLFIFQPIIMGLFAPTAGMEFQHQRYSTHFAPLFILTSSFGLFQIIRYITQIRYGKYLFHTHTPWLDQFYHLRQQKWNKSLNDTRVYKYLVLTCLVIVLLWSVISLSNEMVTYTLNVKNINEMQVNIAKYLRENTPGNSIIATNDIGALGFYSERKIVDLVGLITPEIIPYIMRPGYYNIHVVEYLKTHPVDYVVIFPVWFPAFDQNKNLFREVYRITLKDNTICGSDTMVVYKVIAEESR